jgi:hypothetical protein
MANTQTLIAEVYSAFNQRNIDGALALMRESVSWPKASEGGRVVPQRSPIAKRRRDSRSDLHMRLCGSQAD